MKQLRTEIGFEEKREKLVYSLSQKLVDTVKQNPELYFRHEGRICADPETSLRVLKSQERSRRSIALANQDDREIALVRDLNSGSRRSALASSKVSESRAKSSFVGLDATTDHPELTEDVLNCLNPSSSHTAVIPHDAEES